MPNDTRIITLEGALNFRDIGGYVGKDGRKLRRGRVFRSAELSGLTDGDLAVIAYEDGTIGVRRLYQEMLRIRLESARKTSPPEFVSRVVVIGIVVGVIRQY